MIEYQSYIMIGSQLSSLSNAITSSTASPRFSNILLSMEQAEDIRKEYLTIMSSGDCWYNTMCERLQVSEHGNVNVTLNGQTRSLTFPFYIGRQSPPDKTLGMSHLIIPKYGSRCHLLCLLVNGEIMLVDPGSLTGTKTIKRSYGLYCEHTLPNQRRVLKF